MTKFNEFLGKYVNIVNLIGIVIAIIALLISIISYQISTQKADLFLTYQVYDVDMYNKFYENDKGIIKLDIDYHVVDSVRNESVGVVTIARPGSQITFNLENRGKVAAKNPVINFKFINLELSFLDENNWQRISHNHGLGTWSEIRWQPADNTVIHKGIPKSFKSFSFSESIILEGANIEVIISADNADTKSFKIPVEVNKVVGQ